MNEMAKAVGSFALLFGAGLLKALVPEVPIEIVLAVVAIVPAMWALPPVAKALGIRY